VRPLLYRKLRRALWCRLGHHRESIHSSLRQQPWIPGFCAPKRDGELGYVCWDCERVALLGSWQARVSNRKVRT
jgi:hypothetical protein